MTHKLYEYKYLKNVLEYTSTEYFCPRSGPWYHVFKSPDAVSLCVTPAVSLTFLLRGEPFHGAQFIQQAAQLQHLVRSHKEVSGSSSKLSHPAIITNITTSYYYCYYYYYYYQLLLLLLLPAIITTIITTITT